ncbi:MAG: DUF6776 family protein [Gammaproteobacteria bacterium]|nr:DUF6776 family protein [Gammaproteobacteria bacterium]
MQNKKVKVNVPQLEKISMSAYHPGLKRIQILVSILAAVSVAWAFYAVGAAGIDLPFEDNEQSVAELRVDLGKANKDLKSLRREVARLTRSTQVELQAAEQTKQTLREKEMEILKLTEELVFYRSLLAPEKSKVGVEIRDFSLRSTGQSEYYYDFLLTQSSRSKRVAKGKINVTIDGKQNGKMHRIEVFDVAAAASDTIKYSFKYFQRLNGAFELPDNFEPKKILVEIKPEAKSKQPIQLSYSWNELISGS